MELREFFEEHSEVAIAFSGGCDSAYLLYEASKLAKRVKAYFVKTAFQPDFELEDAKRFASEYSIDLKVIQYDVLKDDDVCANPGNRCYFCKNKIMGVIKENAKNDGFDVLLEGTNASDEETDRPGMKVLAELNILSPLRMCGITKGEVRERSKEAGLFTWDKPAYACLATRIPADTFITGEMLANTEKAESFLSSLGFSDYRVRYREGNALIQLVGEQHELYEKEREKIEAELGKYYSTISLDPTPRWKSVHEF